jgi:UPF0755 protein
MNCIRYLSKLYLNGIIFILFIAGYTFFTLLRIYRLMQKKVGVAVVLGSMAVVIMLCCCFYYYMMPFGNDHRPLEYVIVPKTKLHDVARYLQQQQVIRSDKALIAWMRLKKMERKIQSGIVHFERGDGVVQASKKLLLAKPIEINLMVPEGLTIEQTAHQISRTITIDTAKFISLCYDSAFIASCNLSVATLEGYLFPNTYRLPEKITEEYIIRRMVEKHSATWLNVSISPKIAQRYSQHQIVTLASIIEREATLFTEQPRISGVFHNRLRLGYPLGADPTVRFALKKFSGQLRVSELNSNSPYNTRKFAGLPPGPICSPGKNALEAAANPLDTKDMYFVAKWDGSGEHDFSVTNAEHEKKKIEIRNNNERRIKRKVARVN